MSGPSTKPNQSNPVLVPHPDTEEDVRAGLEEAERGEYLSDEDAAAHLQALIGADE